MVVQVGYIEAMLVSRFFQEVQGVGMLLGGEPDFLAQIFLIRNEDMEVKFRSERSHP